MTKSSKKPIASASVSGRKQKAAPTPLSFAPVDGVVKHTPLTLIEVQDSADLDALLHDPRVAAFIVTRLDPTFALVTPGSEKPLLEALRKAGHTPRVASQERK